MPIYENPEVSKSPVVGLGVGDVYICVGRETKEDGSADRWLLFRGGYEPGAIGLREETGRTDGPPVGSTTAGNPVDVAIHFAAEASVDQVLAHLLEIKASFAAKGELPVGPSRCRSTGSCRTYRRWRRVRTFGNS